MGNAITAEFDKDMDPTILLHRFRYHMASGFITPSDVVLDLGCGTGYGTKIVSDKAMEVRSFDKEQGNIDYARRYHTGFNTKYTIADLETMEIPKADVACCFEVIEHLYKPKEFVTKLKEKIGRYIIASVPVDQGLVIVNGDPQEIGDATHHSVFTQESFENMFVDDIWKRFYIYRDGVTVFAIFYNKNMEVS